jgi:chromosome segregation ATPase
MFKILKKISEWFKNLPPSWKKFLSYVGVFVLGVVITIAAGAYSYSKLQTDLKRTGNRVTEQLISIQDENSRLRKQIQSAEIDLRGAIATIEELRNSAARSKAIIAGLTDDNKRLAEGTRQLSTTIGKLESENNKLREGNANLERTNIELKGTINKLAEFIAGSFEDFRELEGFIDRCIEIVRGL